MTKNFTICGEYKTDPTKPLKLIDLIRKCSGENITIPFDIEVTRFGANMVKREQYKDYDLWLEGDLEIAVTDVKTNENLTIHFDGNYDTRSGCALSGYTYNATTEDGEISIPIGKFLQELANKIGVQITIPSFLATLSFSDITFNFDLKKEDFSCTGKATLSDSATLSLTIRIAKQVDGSRNIEFSGSWLISDSAGGAYEFDLLFVKDGANEEFIAVYHSENSQSVSFKEIVSAIDSDAGSNIPDAFSLSIKDALVARVSNDAGSFSYLFAINMGEGVDFSKLGNIPLVGSELSQLQKFSLDFQISYLTGQSSLSADKLAALNQTIAGYGIMLPEPSDKQLLKGLSLFTKLHLGAETINIGVPVTQNSQNGQLNDNPSGGSISTGSNPNYPTQTTSDNISWIKVQKSFGPISLERIGFGYNSGNITSYVDGAVTLAGLSMSLIDLSMSVQITNITNFSPKFDLRGLGLSYQAGAIDIAGGFLRPEGKDNEFDGLATVKTASFSLSAIGCFAEIDDHIGAFIYAMANYPLGGPSFFFVTGLAGGFGYNYNLQAPTIDDLPNFPLVADAISPPAAPIPTDPSKAQDFIASQMEKLGTYVTPKLGEYLIAAGIHFTSFQLIDSFVLLTVDFGKHFEIDILGLSNIQVPPNTPNNPLAEAQLALKVAFIPDEGTIMAQAQLTPNSFILSRACHLTGGFAFYSWFAGEHAGDFVITLGGYNASFNRPDYYPQVPRLGFNWVMDNLSLKGGLYYALMPHMFMAGGSLEATYDTDIIGASFNAGVDFLISWKPFYYAGDAYVDITAYVVIHCFGTHHVEFDAGADLEMWGPEFGGHARIGLHFLFATFHFDVGFGASQNPPPPLQWQEFRNSFLPADDKIVNTLITDGIDRKVNTNGKDYFIINSKKLRITTNSIIPTSKVIVGGVEVPTNNTDFGITPIYDPNNLHVVQTLHDITIKRDGTDAQNDFKIVPIQHSIPKALWNKTPNDINDDSLLREKVVGVEIVASLQPAPAPGEISQQIDKIVLETSPQERDAPSWNNIDKFSPAKISDVWSEINSQITSCAKRDAVLQELNLVACLVADYSVDLAQNATAAPLYGTI